MDLSTLTGVTYKQLEEKIAELDPWVSFVVQYEGSEVGEAWDSVRHAASALSSAGHYEAAYVQWQLIEQMVKEGRETWFDEWVEDYVDFDGQQEYAKLTGKPVRPITHETWDIVLRITAPAHGTPIGDHSTANSPDHWNFEMMLNQGRDPEERLRVQTIRSKRISVIYGE